MSRLIIQRLAETDFPGEFSDGKCVSKIALEDVVGKVGNWKSERNMDEPTTSQFVIFAVR